MRIKKGLELLHDCLLIAHNKFRLNIESNLKEDVDRRSSIHENYRASLEARIGRWKDMIKGVDNTETNLREIFNYIDYDIDSKFSIIKELKEENEKLKKEISKLKN